MVSFWYHQAHKGFPENFLNTHTKNMLIDFWAVAFFCQVANEKTDKKTGIPLTIFF